MWETFEIEVRAQKKYENPYMEVDVWADLKGPEFNKRIYGFWDGGNTFKIRVTATAAGAWTFVVGSNTNDPGLNGSTGELHAVAWTEVEKRENPCRRGMVISTANGHAFMYADRTPVYILADTEWPLMTYRYPWYDDETSRPPTEGVGFKDVVRKRREQGYNAVAVILSYPGWQNDGHPSTVFMEDGKNTTIRNAWRTPGFNAKTGKKSAKDMHNEGGKPFDFPGVVPGYEDVFPDVTRINPKYFQYVDRKVDYLNAHGFTVFMEAVRRDASTAWKCYYPWPESYTRYVHYMFCRYQTNNCLYSPVHFDNDAYSISGREYNEPANLVIEKYGAPPFGTLCGSNSNATTLADFGHRDEAKWLTFHQIGNFAREHDHYWYLTQIFHLDNPVPALNGEPYYPGDKNGNGRDRIQVAPDCEEANLRFRSGLYGNFLSGGFAGYFYGAEGMWGGDIEPEATYKVWDALSYPSGDQIKHINSFISGVGEGYVDLVPNSELVTPNKSGEPLGYKRWAYCAHTPDMKKLLLYFEKWCPRAAVRGLPYGGSYRLQWFDPREGVWIDDDHVDVIPTNSRCRIDLPNFPTENDYGMCLTME